MTLLSTLPPIDSAAWAYDALAPAYDVLTAGYCHEDWLCRIEGLAKAHGLAGRRLLDVACGTGKSFLPLAERGYAVTACDISSGMVELAKRKWPEASVGIEDMRALPQLGEFDLVTCLDDAVNYLLEDAELAGFFQGIARNLAPDGIAVFDVNALRVYREEFCRDWLLDDPAAFIAWAGSSAAGEGSSQRFSARVHVFEPDGENWRRTVSSHEQRHWTQPELIAAAAAASLRVAGVYGQHRGARIDDCFDEAIHTKALLVLRHDGKG